MIDFGWRSLHVCWVQFFAGEIPSAGKSWCCFTDKNIVCTSKIGVESVKSDFECFCHLVTWDLLGKSPFLLHKSRSFPTFSGPGNSAFQVPSFQHSRALHLDRHHFASGSRPIFGSLSSSGWLVIFRQKTKLVGGFNPSEKYESQLG
jgi:hypothetical protein